MDELYGVFDRLAFTRTESFFFNVVIQFDVLFASGRRRRP